MATDWRSLMTVSVCALAVAGCGDLACRNNTVFATFSLSGLTGADGVDVSVSVDGGPAKSTHLALASGLSKGSVEIDFPAGYPRGSTVALHLDIKSATTLVASGTTTINVSHACESAAVPLTPAPVPNKHQGDACGADDICDTGNCVDGFCCDQPCTGQCEACDVSGAIGSCTPVSDAVPHGARAACSGSGTCGGRCDGTTRTTCSYSDATVICGAACDGHCDGTGGCTSVAGGSCPNGFACGGSGCNTSCANDMDCQPNFHCAAPNCVRNPESDCLDGKDNNGDGLADCQDPTCATLVGCVPSAPAGDELGMLTTGACPTEFPTTEPQHQGLNAPACDTSGCVCQNYVSCQVSFSYSSASDCSSAKTLVQTIKQGFGSNPATYPGNVPACSTIITQAFNSYKVNSVSYVTTECGTTGTKTPPPTSWTTSSNFCSVGKTSATCDSSHVCAPLPATPQSMCVRIPQGGASCPSGYGGQSATWYTQVNDTRSCSCGCSVMQVGDCGGANVGVGISGHAANTCPLSSSDPGCGNNNGGACMANGNLYCGLSGNIGAIGVTSIGLNPGQCTNTIVNNGSAAPAGASTICCQ